MSDVLLLARPEHAALPGLADAVGAWVLAGATVSSLPPCDDAPAALHERLATAVPDLLVAVGGDGTVHLAANALHAAGALDRTAVAVVPAGTGNDLAGQLDAAVPMRPRALARVTAWLKEGGPGPACRERRVDLLEVAEEVSGEGGRTVVANVLSIGPAAHLTATTPAGLKEGLGGLAYLLHGLGNLSEVQPFPCTVEGTGGPGEGISFEGDALGLFVANGQRAGGGLTVAGDAALDSGRARVVVVPDMPLAELAGAMSRGLAGTPEEHARVLAADVEQLRIRVPTDTPASFDGEPRGLHHATLRVRPGALRLLAPAGTGTHGTGTH